MEPSHLPPTTRGPLESFSGDVFIDTIASPEAPPGVMAISVHFTPGARTAWHSHDGGQTLYVTEGRGVVQSRGKARHELRAGDVHVTPDGEEHWHGATPDHFLTHLSLTKGPPKWGAHVTDEEYLGDASS